MSGIVELLSKYPGWVAERLLSPVSGIPAKHTFLPSIKELRDFCEGEYHITRYAIEWNQAAQEQQKLLNGPVTPKPTIEELKEKHGQNWGLQTIEPENDEAKAKRVATLEKANRRAFEAECEAAGWPKDSSVSPSLAALINARG